MINIAAAPIFTWPLFLLLTHIHMSLSDFAYYDFNKTTGLVFNGAASTTDCGKQSEFVESDSSNDGDVARLDQQGYTATSDVFSIVETAIHNSSDDEIAIHNATFGHRSGFAAGITTGCSTRLR